MPSRDVDFINSWISLTVTFCEVTWNSSFSLVMFELVRFDCTITSIGIWTVYAIYIYRRELHDHVNNHRNQTSTRILHSSSICTMYHSCVSLVDNLLHESWSNWRSASHRSYLDLNHDFLTWLCEWLLTKGFIHQSHWLVHDKCFITYLNVACWNCICLLALDAILTTWYERGEHLQRETQRVVKPN